MACGERFCGARVDGVPGPAACLGLLAIFERRFVPFFDGCDTCLQTLASSSCRGAAWLSSNRAQKE